MLNLRTVHIPVFPGGKLLYIAIFLVGKMTWGEKALYNTGTPLDFMVLSFYDFLMCLQ